jgi:cytidylate kinase
MAEGDKWDTPFVVFPQTDVRVNLNASPAIRAAFEDESPTRKHGR